MVQYAKSGKLRETKRIEDPSERRAKMSHKTKCAYTIRFFKTKGKNLFDLLDPKNENELCHNHLILLSTPKGRKSILEVDGMKTISFGLEQNPSTHNTQNTISKDSPYNKLTKDDVKNMKSVYNQQIREASQRVSTEQANVLIQQMQSNGYMTFYDFDQTMFLKSIFFASKPMTEKAKQFPEVMVIDANYKTNNLGMPLIGIYGVANIGQRSFKSFPVAFAWTSNEQETTYQ